MQNYKWEREAKNRANWEKSIKAAKDSTGLRYRLRRRGIIILKM
jgi:hypothetical protein